MKILNRCACTGNRKGVFESISKSLDNLEKPCQMDRLFLFAQQPTLAEVFISPE